MKIAVDAMGGDRAPEVIIQGAIDAVHEFDLPIILVGNQEILEKELARIRAPHRFIEIHHCSQVVGMDDDPIDVIRKKKDASVRVAFELVKNGVADAAVSAGNSGATLAAGTVVLGRMAGVERPGIAGIFPTLKGRTVIIDIGANVDCKPSFLYHFGIMAAAYAQEALKIPNPKVGLLSIGEEDSKGNDLVRRTHDLLKSAPLNFIGNVEGRDVFTGAADVIVCDGFVGNVVLKLSEGAVEAIGFMLREELKAGWLSRIGAWLSLGAYKRFRRKVDYAEFGGAPLLGIKGVGIISHGGSSPKAIKNAIGTAAGMIQADLTNRLQERLRQLGHPPSRSDT